MKKQISIAWAAGLLMAGVSVASAIEMQQSFPHEVVPSARQALTYSQQYNNYAHKNGKGQQHTALRASWHNVD
jgi:hypothetical protein